MNNQTDSEFGSNGSEYVWLSDEETDRSNHNEHGGEDCNDHDKWCSEESDGDDELFHEEDRVIDTWMAKFPCPLYPRLLVICPDSPDGKVETPLRDLAKSCHLFRMPIEVRLLIYDHYFHEEIECRRRSEAFMAFPEGAGDSGRRRSRLVVSSTNAELKYWLSQSLLHCCRQLRFESLSLLLRSRVFTIEWLGALPRFVAFLGPPGCSMIRYLDLWDYSNMQRAN